MCCVDRLRSPEKTDAQILYASGGYVPEADSRNVKENDGHRLPLSICCTTYQLNTDVSGGDYALSDFATTYLAGRVRLT
jgi:hypothetical protein